MSNTMHFLRYCRDFSENCDKRRLLKTKKVVDRFSRNLQRHIKSHHTKLLLARIFIAD